MNILGISAYYHDSAACLLRDGRIVAAAEEERFSRKKHDASFPAQAIAYCLREGATTDADLDAVVFYEKPLLKFDRLFETFLAFAPSGFRPFRNALPRWIKQKLRLTRELANELPRYGRRHVFVEHHEAHAASAFFASPFSDAAIMTLDGVGEWATATLGTGHGNRISLSHELRFPHSLGLLYAAFTYFTGFKVNSGEYKMMGLAPYGEPKFAQLILDHLLDLKEDGSFRLNLSYFNYCQGLTMTSPRMDALLGGAPRCPDEEITQREKDIAASIQRVTEEVLLRCSRFLSRETGMRHLVMAGGVALNCVANGRILRDGAFDDVWIQPAAGDGGGAIGAALFAWHQLADQARAADEANDSQQASMLGPQYGNDEVRATLERVGARYHFVQDESKLLGLIVERLIRQDVVGFFRGRMEFGPRALGSRSILADPRSSRMQSELNLKTKFRESFRPFAAAVLREHVHEWFEMRPGQDSAYMLLVAPVKQGRSLPAVTHVDGSARVQTVDQRHARFSRLLGRFHQETGCPVVVNTSFNIRGEPIVCAPEDAYRCFISCKMDVLVIEDFVLYREEQRAPTVEEVDAYKATFDLD